MSEILNQAWEDVADDVTGAIEKAVQPLLKRAVDDIYGGLLDATQDYLKDNLAFNIASRISTAERAAERDRYEFHTLLREVIRIADDYHPSRDEETPLALAEMREALNTAIAKARGEGALALAGFIEGEGGGMTWVPETFEVAFPCGPLTRTGYTYRGLGLWKVTDASPKGRRPTKWSLTHLGSGHLVVLIAGDVATAFPIATEIAEAGDWDFLSRQGYKDRFPDAAQKISEIMERHNGVTIGGRGQIEKSHEIAAQIASNRP